MGEGKKEEKGLTRANKERDGVRSEGREEWR